MRHIKCFNSPQLNCQTLLDIFYRKRKPNNSWNFVTLYWHSLKTLMFPSINIDACGYVLVYSRKTRIKVENVGGWIDRVLNGLEDLVRSVNHSLAHLQVRSEFFRAVRGPFSTTKTTRYGGGALFANFLEYVNFVQLIGKHNSFTFEDKWMVCDVVIEWDSYHSEKINNVCGKFSTNVWNV